TPLTTDNLDQPELRDIAADGRLGDLESALGEALRERLLAADLVAGDELANCLLPSTPRGATVRRDAPRRVASLHGATIPPRSVQPEPTSGALQRLGNTVRGSSADDVRPRESSLDGRGSAKVTRHAAVCRKLPGTLVVARREPRGDLGVVQGIEPHAASLRRSHELAHDAVRGP